MPGSVKPEYILIDYVHLKLKIIEEKEGTCSNMD
jgi:hypothetical protein